LKQCFQIMEEGRGVHFDPTVLDAFFARREDIVRVKIDLADSDR
jgi:putative two-component system response regulator